MINAALYRREMKGSIRLLIILAAVVTLYVAVIISMYDPAMMAMLDSFSAAMPELMASVGMRPGATSLLGFMVSYLYGFILLVFPLAFCVLRANGLVAKYADNGSLAMLLAAPVRRVTVALTQLAALLSGLTLLMVYCTVLELVCAAISFPGELNPAELLRLNGALMCLHLFLGGICFLASCAFSDARYSLGFGAGIPALMLVLQMLANTGGAAERAKYFTCFTLFDPQGIIAGASGAAWGALVLLAGAAVLDALAVAIFCRRDLSV